ncbi:hypothetical protein EI94DRAFT_371145 [Lactarius quietus]|nr:hypothetical protein EI94DRAFT_371145 [Lactarius quietus]
MALRILGRIRSVYLALHQDIDFVPNQLSASTGDLDHILCEPSSYPVCNIPSHHPRSIPHIHDDSASQASARAVPHDHNNTSLTPSFRISSPDAPSSFAHVPLRVDETLKDVPQPDDTISITVSLQPVDQPTPDNRRIHPTLPNPVTACATHRGIDTSPRTTHLSTLEPSASTPLPKSQISSPDAISIEHAAISGTLSDDEGVPS